MHQAKLKQLQEQEAEEEEPAEDFVDDKEMERQERAKRRQNLKEGIVEEPRGASSRGRLRKTPGYK